MPLTLPHTLTAGTNENVTHVQNNFVEIANAFPVQAANIGDSQVTTAKIADGNVLTAKLAAGAVTPRKQSTLYHVVNQTGAGFVPFSGLDGNAAYSYEIQGFLYTTSVTPTDNLQVRPNSATTNFLQPVYHQTTYNAGVPAQNVAVGSTAGLNIGTGTAASVNRTQFRATLQAKTGQGRRIWNSQSVFDNVATGAPYVVDHSAFWDETTTNITSLQFVWPGVGAVINGWISLRALAEA